MNDENQYVLRVFNRDALSRGFVVRTDGWKGDPPSPRRSGKIAYSKARTYMDGPAEVQQSWYRPTLSPGEIVDRYGPGHWGALYSVPTGTIVLVEDQISAMKVAEAGLIGVALLGTNLTYDKIREIQQEQPTQVIVALDQDASAIAFDMVRNFSPAFRSMRVALLEKDLKDLPTTDVLPALGLSA